MSVRNKRRILKYAQRKRIRELNIGTRSLKFLSRILNNVFKKTQKTMASSMAIIYYNMSNKRDDCS